jgi:hypothetical protein
MPILVTTIPASLRIGQTARLAVYCYANPGNTTEVPWTEARQIVVDAQRSNGALVQASVGTATAPEGMTLAEQEGVASLADLVARFWP